MASVPVIDLGPARAGAHVDRLAVARSIDAACREIGFFAITGHGIPDALVEDLRGRAHGFFALPLAAKLAARHPVPGTNRGYHPVAGETLASANDDAAPPDLKEFFHVGPVDVSADPYYTGSPGRRHFEPNLWPGAPAGFEAAATELRLNEARSFVQARVASGDVLIVSASRGAADDLARSVARECGATIGLHRFSLRRLR